MHTPLKVVVLLGALVAFAASARPENQSECVLDKMPGVKTDGEAAAIWKSCVEKFGSPRDVKQGSGRGLFGYDSGDECTDKKADGTPSRTGVTMIRTACRKLYDDPNGPKATRQIPEESSIDQLFDLGQ